MARSSATTAAEPLQSSQMQRFRETAQAILRCATPANGAPSSQAASSECLPTMSKQQLGAPSLMNLDEARRAFADPDAARDYLVRWRWPDGVVCPECGRRDPYTLRSRALWRCQGAHAAKDFSITCATIFVGSKMTMTQMALCVWVWKSKARHTAASFSNEAGVNPRTAWRLLSLFRQSP